MEKVKLMKGNEAVAEAAIRAGCDGYFGYPITPQSEVMEYLSSENLEERSGMILLQAESEIAAINMIFGGAGCGKKVMCSSSGPGISLMQEGLSYIAGAELPCLVVNVERGGPGLGTIQPSQADYFQAVKGGGHGDYKLITLAPASVQEMADFVSLGFELAFKYRNPVMILSDGAIGQMMEKVKFSKQIPRMTKLPDWATTGKSNEKKRNLITSLYIQPQDMEKHNQKLQKKYREVEKNEVRFEKYMCDDAEYLIVAFGTCARVSQKTIEIAREKGLKVGLLRPITIYPYPSAELNKLADSLKGILTVEMNSGQMLEDVKLSVSGKVKVEFHGRMGGMIPTPEEVLEILENKLIKNG
ncbi:3-methyl-2-oxobutanoate dehydrogenase subunit VorB [Bacteroidota bacterium]